MFVSVLCMLSVYDIRICELMNAFSRGPLLGLTGLALSCFCANVHGIALKKSFFYNCEGQSAITKCDLYII